MSRDKITVLYGLFVALLVFILGMAYANITTELKVEGTGDGTEQEGVYITDVEYLTNNGADTTNSKINYYLGTMLDSKVVLGSSTSSSITYQVTIKNNTSREQVFIGIVKDETNEEIYSNTSIQPNVETAGGITGIEAGVTTIAPGEYLTFPVTYAYAGTDTSNPELEGKINFRFREKPILELSNEGETYTLENIAVGHEEEYEFTVSNYNENYNNTVPLTYTFEIELTEGSPLEAKIYDQNGLEVTERVNVPGDNTTQVDHSFTLKITWDSSFTDTEYEGQEYTCNIKLKALPVTTADAELADYGEYKIEKEFGVNITTCAHESYANGACTVCGKKAPFTADGSWDGTINTPILTDDMEPVAWDEDGNEFTPQTNEEWYNYKDQASGVDGTSNWANAKTSDGSYWVWIPRYEYKITSQPADSAGAGTIDVNFIPVSTNATTSGYTTTTDINQTVNGVAVLSKGITVSSNGYIIHPAFTSDVDVGGWDSELPGIWVAKYEMSMETSGVATTTNNSTIGNVATSSTIKMVSKPGVPSWSCINISNAYENSLAYDSDKNSHLMKNSERGAVAYLTHSQYGRNGNQVDINACSGYYTGAGPSAAGSTSEYSYDSSNFATTYAYNTTLGKLASSTGNITGIYDLAGGTNEFVAAFNDTYSGTGDYYSKTNASYKSASGNNMGAIGITNGGSTKYLTAYRNATVQYVIGQQTGNKYTSYLAFAAEGHIVSITGDAISEVWVSGTYSWYRDRAYLTNINQPFNSRGGYATDGTNYSGIFSSSNTGAILAKNNSFRVALTQTQIQESCNHTYSDWVTTSTQNCGFDGINKRICSLCGKTEFQVTEATGIHSYRSWVTVKEATCVDTGLQTKTCTICRDIQSQSIATKEHTYEKQTIPTGAGTKFATTGNYSDGTNTAVIPAGFTVSGVNVVCTVCGNELKECTIAEGLVIYLIDDMTTTEIANIAWDDATTLTNLKKTYDQFVWIPMPKANINDMYMCQSKTSSTTCNIGLNSSGQAYCSTHKSTAMAGRLYASSTGNNYTPTLATQTYKADSGLREPAVVTGSSSGTGTSYDGSTTYLAQLNGILGTSYSTSSSLLTDLQSEYNEIVKSVYENEGFYIGRYETSGMKDSNTNATVKIVAGSDNTTNSNISSVTWYRMYAQQKKYASNKELDGSIGSTMIQGAAYDQVMKFIDPETSFVKTTGKVEHSDYSNWSSYPYQTGGINYYSVYPGNVDYNDVAKNIYDLEGNVSAWTTEVSGTGTRVRRGGSYGVSDSPSYRGSYYPSNRSTVYGSVCQLYIHDEHTYVNGVCGCGETNYIPTSTPYVGCYADMDRDGQIDGVIFADQGYGMVGTSPWGDDWGPYSVTKIESGLKEYEITQESYTNSNWGTHEVISPVSGTTGTDRFYVMALSDLSTSTYAWYSAAYGNLDSSRNVDTTTDDFGTGKSNTIFMVSAINAGTYGTGTSSDLWKVIQNNSTYPLVTSTSDSGKWFIPSKGEWSAFGGELGITSSNYSSTYGLSYYYWSSSQYITSYAYFANFGNDCMFNSSVNRTRNVRLCTTF